MNEISPYESSCPVVENPYFGTAQVNFGPPLGVTVVMDAMPLNPTSGFIARKDMLTGMPSVREWGVVVLAILLIGYAGWRVTRRFKAAPNN